MIVGATPSTSAVLTAGAVGAVNVSTGVPTESVSVAVAGMVMTGAGIAMPSVSRSPAWTTYWNLMAVVPVPLT